MRACSQDLFCVFLCSSRVQELFNSSKECSVKNKKKKNRHTFNCLCMCSGNWTHSLVYCAAFLCEYVHMVGICDSSIKHEDQKSQIFALSSVTQDQRLYCERQKEKER